MKGGDEEGRHPGEVRAGAMGCDNDGPGVTEVVPRAGSKSSRRAHGGLSMNKGWSPGER